MMQQREEEVPERGLHEVVLVCEGDGYGARIGHLKMTGSAILSARGEFPREAVGIVHR